MTPLAQRLRLVISSAITTGAGVMMAPTLRTALGALPQDRPFVCKGAIRTVSQMLGLLGHGLLEDHAVIERDGSIIVGDPRDHLPLLLVRLRCVDCARPSDRLRDGVPVCDGCTRRPGA